MIDRSLNYGRHWIERFLRKLGPIAGAVDLGAGRGTDLAMVRRVAPDCALHAVECWPPYVEELSAQGVAVHPLNIEKDALPFPSRSVDVVIANQVLEHTKELFWIFHETTRVLRKGGAFLVGVPNLASLHNRFLLAIGRQPTSIKSASAHVRGFTKPDLLDFIETCFPHGYDLRGFGGSNFYPFPPAVARPLARLFPTMAWGMFFMLEKRGEYTDEFIRYPTTHPLETNYFLGTD